MENSIPFPGFRTDLRGWTVMAHMSILNSSGVGETTTILRISPDRGKLRIFKTEKRAL